MHISLLICEKMSYNEVIYFHNLQRYALYKGYQQSLEYVGPVDIEQGAIRKDIMAIDALKFKN